jgi:hypothetical protein
MKKIVKFGLAVLMAGAFVACDENDEPEVLPTEISAGTLSGGPYTFLVGDGIKDNLSGVGLTGNSGDNSSFILTNASNEILGLPADLVALQEENFDGAPPGICYVWHVSYNDDLEGLSTGNSTDDLSGTFEISNRLTINRNLAAVGGTLTGGPFTFDAGDGIVDNVSGIALTGNVGDNSIFLVTDAAGTILGLPPTLTALEGVDFDGAGEGVCLIWHLSYQNDLQGLAEGASVNDFSGAEFSLSNSIIVNRNIDVEAGTLTGGPYTFIVGDGEIDNVSNVSITGAPVGTNKSFIVTDEDGSILGLPGDLEALKGVNFDGAGEGVCLIWYIRYEGEITGLAMGMNTNNLKGNFDLSNAITINRIPAPDAGTLEGGPYTFVVGNDIADNVANISISGNPVGTNKTFIVTDGNGEILGLPGDLDALKGVKFDGAGVGVCLIWYLRYEGEITGLEVGGNANNLEGTFDLSNSVTINRVAAANAGTLEGGPYTFVAGDGTADTVSNVSIAGSPAGANKSFIVTDAAGNIFGLPGDLDALKGVNFDGAGVGECLIWYIRYEGEITGLEAGMNTNNLSGSFDLSNSISVNRVAAPDAGTLTGGPYTFTSGDGVADNVSNIAITGTPVGAKKSFIVTDEAGNILGLPGDLDALKGVNFDGAGVGVCLIWYIRYEGELTGLEAGMNANNLQGIFDLSNSITVNRQ